MAEKSMACQNTGNPVLDSLVNLVLARGAFTVEQLSEWHGVLLELAEKEPGGLRRHGGTILAAKTGAKLVPSQRSLPA